MRNYAVNDIDNKISGRNKLSLFFGLIVFKVITDIVYTNHVSTIFGYTGFHSEFVLGRYLLSWLILFLFIPFIIKLHKKILFSSVIIILLSYLSIVPFTTMVGFYPYSRSFIFQNSIYWLSIIMFNKLIPRMKFKRVKSDKLVELILYAIILMFFLTIIYISWRYTGFRVTIDIFNVYALRGEASNFKLPTIISYIYSAAKAVNPILMVYFLSKNRKGMAIAIFILQILNFSINGSKTVLFSTVLAMLLYFYYNRKYLMSIPWLLSLLGAASSLEILINKSFFIVAFIIRRVYFVPNLLSYYYFDFFSSNTPDYFRQSFLRHLGFVSPYNNIDNMIAGIYFNRPDMGANNGLISDAYANFGILGLIIMPLLIILSLKFLDACADGLDIKIYIISAITISFIFISSFLFTVLLTHGFLAICLILYLLPRNSKYTNNISKSKE